MILLQRFYHRGVPSFWHLALDGLLASLTGALFAWWLFPAEASLVAVFLAAIACDDSVERILDDNRSAIFERAESAWDANAELTLRVLGLFVGAFVAFGLLGLLLPLDTIATVFHRQVVHSGPLESLDFGSFGAVLANNLYVLLFFFAVAIPFRHGGVMLAVAWNASVWGMTFGALARGWSAAGGPGPLEAMARVTAAVGVHMGFEAVGYVLAGLSGVFLSKAVVKHAWSSDTMVEVTKTVAAKMAAALALITVGALWEARLAGHLVGWIS